MEVVQKLKFPINSNEQLAKNKEKCPLNFIFALYSLYTKSLCKV